MKKKNIKMSKEDCCSINKKYNVDIIAIGNGTASRESEKVSVVK